MIANFKRFVLRDGWELGIGKKAANTSCFPSFVQYFLCSRGRRNSRRNRSISRDKRFFRFREKTRFSIRSISELSAPILKAKKLDTFPNRVLERGQLFIGDRASYPPPRNFWRSHVHQKKVSHQKWHSAMKKFRHPIPIFFSKEPWNF